MSGETDPSTWHEVLKYLWAVLLIPVSLLWKKVENAASKEDVERAREETKADLLRAIDAMRDDTREGRETMKLLFANAESDRYQNNERFAKTQDLIRTVQVELLNRLNGVK